MPRTLMSIGTPACEASYSAWMHAPVDQRVELEHDRRVLAVAVGLRRSCSISSSSESRIRSGATSDLAVAGRPGGAGQRVEQCRPRRPSISAVGGEEAEVLVQAGGLGVVVARAHVHVVAHAAALAADDQQRLGVGLEAGQAVHHVRARLFQRAGPADVAALVEAGLELHQAHGLLAPLGGLDQQRHQRRVVGGAVHGHLDRQHVRVAHGLLHQPLHAARERVVGVVDQQVALRAWRRRRRACPPGWRTAAGVHRRPGLLAQLAESVEAVDLPQVAQVEQRPRRRTTWRSSMPSCSTRNCAQLGVDARADLQPDDLAEAAARAARPRPRAAGRRPRRRRRSRRRGPRGRTRGSGSPCPGRARPGAGR